MKKLVFGLLFSFLLYIIANYIFLKRSSSARDTLEENFNRAEMQNSHGLNEQARADAVFSTSTLRIENDTQSDIYLKVIKAEDNSTWMTLMLGKGVKRETGIPQGEYYLKMKYNNGKEVYYSRGDNFNIPENSKTTINLKEVIFGNYGTSSMGAGDF